MLEAAYLIIENFSDRCKFFQIERQKYTISLHKSRVFTFCAISQFYTHSVLQIKSYTIYVIYTDCAVSHAVWSFTLSVYSHTHWVVLHSVCSSFYAWCSFTFSVFFYTKTIVWLKKAQFTLFCRKINFCLNSHAFGCKFLFSEILSV